MNRIAVTLLILSCFITGCIGGDFCGEIGPSGLQAKYCEYGCCDDDCCTKKIDNDKRILVETLQNKHLIAIVVGSVIGLVTLISICVCICCCLCSNNGHRPGQVMVSPQPNHVIYTNGAVQTAGMPPSYAYPSTTTQTNLHQLPPQPPNTKIPEPGYNLNTLNVPTDHNP